MRRSMLAIASLLTIAAAQPAPPSAAPPTTAADIVVPEFSSAADIARFEADVAERCGAPFNVIRRRIPADEPPGTIVAQEPAAGARIACGQTVVIALSRGHPSSRPAPPPPAPPPPPPAPPPTPLPPSPPPTPPGGESGEAEAQLPAFPLPAPKPSAQMALGPAVYGAARTLGDLDAMLTGRLTARGYDAGKYYGVPGGFALVAPIERITAAGAPYREPGRWSLAATSLGSSCSIGHLLDCLLHADPGRYRVLVFMATRATVLSSGSVPTFDKVQNWVANGGSFLPDSIRRQPLAGRHVAVLVYEFVRPAVDKMPAQISTLSALAQLRAAGIVR